tara:strand:- start:401 stop:1090 length:690 start_codon:yes stop_codon:yes gene_type:complete
MKGGCEIGRKNEPKGGCKVGKKLKFKVNKPAVKPAPKKLKFKVNKPAVKPAPKKLKFKVNKPLAKKPESQLSKMTGLSRAEANKMDPAQLFGMLPKELGKMVLQPSRRGGGVSVGTPLKFNPSSGLLDTKGYNNRGRENIKAIINDERRNLRKQLNRLLKKKGGKGFTAAAASRPGMEKKLQSRLMSVGVSRAELEKIFKSYERKAQNKASTYISETERKARDPSEGVY